MTTETRRAISPAAPAPRSDAWRQFAACASQDRDRFYSDSPKALKEVRSFCRSCPVLEQCLTSAMRQENGRDRWGVLGGLAPVQRLALAWEERLHGRRPDFAAARLLASPRWRYTLHGMNRLTPDVAARRLVEAGLDVDAVTVRLALWWIGESGTRLRKRRTRKESEVDRLIRLYGSVIRQLRAIGASHHDVAAYLGAPEPAVSRAAARLEKADRQETADMVGEMEVAA